MKMDDLLEVIVELSGSQGSYGRLYRALMDLKENSPEEYAELSEVWESKNFGSSLDFILYLES